MAFDLDEDELKATRILNRVEKRTKGTITPQKADKTKMEKKEKEEKAKELKAELIKQEYQDNMKEYMEQRLFDLIHKLKHVDGTLSTIEIKNLLSQKNIVGASPKYNNTELAMLFDYYKQFIDQINKVQAYLPTKKNFCSFIGISSNTYNSWKQSDDSERREILQMIDDYITDLQLTSAQNGEIKEVTTIFRSKAEHGLVEQTAPVVIEHRSETNINEIMKQIEAVNQGKSLQTIELKQNEDGSYGR